MSQRVAVVIPIAIMLLLFSNFIFADLVLLKSGGIMEGEVMNEGSSSVEFKNSSGAVEEIRRDFIASIVRQNELPPNPEEIYAGKVKSIPSENANAHYELGLFCIENSLLDCAFNEFNQAKEIDPSYEKTVFGQIEYIISVKREAERMIALKKAPEILPFLTSQEVASELKKGNIVIPFSQKDAEIIASAINNLASEEAREGYSKKYLESANKYIEKAKSEKSEENKYGMLQTALSCYRIASIATRNMEVRFLIEQKFSDITNKLEEVKNDRLVIPDSTLKRDAVILFIRGIEDKAEKEPYYGRYYYKGGEFEAKIKGIGTSLAEDDRRNLEIALYCYEITQSAHVRNLLSSSLIEAKIRQCKERLKN